MTDDGPNPLQEHHFTNSIVRKFLYSQLSLILILLASLVGIAALVLTPREEDPQIVVPLADVYVDFPGHSSGDVEQLVATPLEKLLYQIDGVEYVYSMSRPGQAIITVRYFVGEDRERSLVKIYKKIQENQDVVPPGVSGWVVKPVEIDDVPIVTMALVGGPDEMALRRVAEELTQRLAGVKDVSRAYVVGGRPRVVNVYLQTDAMAGYDVSPLEIQRAITAANVTTIAGEYQRNDKVISVEAGAAFANADELRELVVAVSHDRPVFLKDVARIEDGPSEAVSYVRHGWGPGRGFEAEEGMAGTAVHPGSGADAHPALHAADSVSAPAVTIAIAKKKGSNAVWVAREVLQKAASLEKEIVPSAMQLVVTRNYGMTANEKVNELVEALAVAIFIVIALLTLGLGWRESLIVAVAVPVVFGLTLAINLLFGFTINRVTLFALILALGLLVDDPIVDVENISRHFAMQKRASRKIVMEAVAEIRPPLITATLAVIVSFLPMFFITGMMGPYMRPMALNVPVAMIMSMLVAFTITPWLAYHVLKRKKGLLTGNTHHDPHDIGDVKQTFLYGLFYPIMAPLLHRRLLAWSFLAVIGLLTAGAMYLAADRSVPLKMLPFDNKNELLLVLDADRGTTLERTDAAVRQFENYLAQVPEVTDFTSYVGVASPMDFNGLVRHYYLRRGPNVAEIRIDLVGKKNRSLQSHALGLAMRDDLTRIARAQNIKLKIVEVPPGPPVLASVVAEVYGQPDSSYSDILNAADVVHARLLREPGVVDTDDSRDAPETKSVFVTDKEKAALHGISVQTIADTLQTGLAGQAVGTIRAPAERNPLEITLRLPEAMRSDPADLSQLRVKGADGALVTLSELGRWQTTQVDQTIYHKNLQRVAYVFAETAGRPPADVVVDVQADRRTPAQIAAEAKGAGHNAPQIAAQGFVASGPPRPLSGRTFFSNGSGIHWTTPDGASVDFAGEGEWKITLDVFRDLGLAFAAAMVAIYVLLVAQTKSFVIPLVVMMAIPLTVLGVMPGFWALNHLSSHMVGAYSDSVFFTATGMIGMIALSGIVTRDSIILVDFIHLSLRRGRSLFDAIMESRVVRLRPILLTAGAAMLSAVPIIVDPIFSGLAWSLIFGLFASTVFTLFVIPICYWLLYANKPGHGLPEEADPAETQPAPVQVRLESRPLARST
ncbi:MAG: efflux RND transporter permease subunit [Phycisphaerae bacterium]